MRSQRDIDKSNRHNETKLLILQCIKKNEYHYIRPQQIADKTGLKIANVYRQCSKLVGQGYIWRRNINKKYRYRFLKPMGLRVLKELWIRKQMNITLNLKKKIELNKTYEYQLYKKIFDEKFK